MSGHTPGPWVIREEQGASGIYLKIGAQSDNNDISIATIGGMQSARSDGGSSGANARLISAAPDLLATLKAIVVDAEKAVNPRARMAHYDDAIAAITKATGKQ